MIAIYFFYGLAFFAMGLAVALESRRNSEIVLSRHLIWLAAFGIVHSLVEWADMFLMLPSAEPWQNALMLTRTLLLPFSAILLIRFGIGLVSETGPLPDWLSFIPIIVLVPVSLLFAYALVVAFTQPNIILGADVWSRYLLYFPGCLLTAFGFIRQWRGLRESGMHQARDLLFGAAAAFFFNAIVAGLVVPPALYGLAPWLNYDTVLNWSGVPVQVWRTITAVVVAFFVLRAMGVFELEREERLKVLRAEREQAQAAALSAQGTQREIAENWTNGLVGITRQIANLENVDEVLGATVNLTRQLLSSDTAILAMWNQSRTQLDLKCFATAQGIQMHNLPAVSSSIIIDAVRSGKLFRFPADAPSGSEWQCPALKQKIHAAAVVPLLFENQLLGGLWVSRVQALPFTEADLTGMERLADQAVIALEYAVMTARLQSLAVTEERSRIAREMHDGLLQILGYLGVQLQTIQALNRQGNRNAVHLELEKTRESIGAAQADVRENVLSLRTTLAGDKGLVDALRDYVEEFQVQTNLQVDFVNGLHQAPRLSPLAEAHLVRIVQEALTNVRKHACATQVQVRLSEWDQTLRMSVTDNGIGFSMTTIKNHFGLQTMRERADSINGVLNLNSEPGLGTQVELALPMFVN